MTTLTNATFVGYAYYSVRGEGFIYTLSSNKDSNSSGSPMTILNVVVDSAAKANNFTSFLLLVVGSALMVGLIALVILSFFCQRKVAQLEKTYWKLQDAFTDVNDTLFQEIKRCTPPAAAIPSPSTKHKHTHQFQAQLAANTPSLPLLMQHGSICTSNVTPVRQLHQQRNPRPYDMNANPFPAAAPTVVHTENAYHHYFSSQDTHTPASFFVTHTPPPSAPHLQEQQRVSGRFSESRSSSAPPEQSPLRRRMSKPRYNPQPPFLSNGMHPQHGHAAGRDVFVELIPLNYSGAVPAPVPACTDPTPDEQRRHAAAEKKAALKQKEARQKAQFDHYEGQTHTHHTTAGQGSASITDQFTTGANEMFSSLKSAFSKAVLTLEKGATDVSTRTEAQVHQLEHQHDCDRFRTHFRELAEQGEVLLADYVCKAMHGGLQVKGHLQITRNYMCFFAETSSAIAKTTDAIMDAFAAARQAASANASAQQEQQQQRLVGIKQVVPLNSIASIQPSVVLETVAGQAPFFMLSPAPTVSPTALQVYTTDKKIYQFLKFDSLISRATGALSDVKGTALDGAYCYLDRAWRDAVTVPLSNVEYA